MDKHIKRLVEVDGMLGTLSFAHQKLQQIIVEIRADWEHIAASQQAAIELLVYLRNLPRDDFWGGRSQLPTKEHVAINRVIKLLEGIPVEEEAE